MKKLHYRLIFLFLSTAIAITALVYCRKMITNELQVQIFENLKDVALQNKITMEKELNNSYSLLLGIADQIKASYPSIDSEEDIYSILAFLERFTDIYDFKRMGYMNMKGIIYTTDGHKVNMSNSAIYSYGLRGLPYVSETLTDTIGSPDDINIFAVPLYSGDNQYITGMVYCIMDSAAT